VLKSRPPFADLDNFPADAQLGLLSMSWGMGPMFNFPKFQAYVAAGDWSSAATECRFQPDTSTITIRNAIRRDRQPFQDRARSRQGSWPSGPGWGSVSPCLAWRSRRRRGA
jgi:hypothetical protein